VIVLNPSGIGLVIVFPFLREPRSLARVVEIANYISETK
jgi:hypothetical protein